MAGTRWSIRLVFAVMLVLPSALYAQVVGPFTVQLAPFCNVITFTVIPQGPVLNVSGFDDNCGGAVRLAASGTIFANPDGTVGGGLSVIAAGHVAIR